MKDADQQAVGGEPRASKLAPLTEWRMPAATPSAPPPQPRMILSRRLPPRAGWLLGAGFALIAVIAGAIIFLSEPDVGDLVAATPVSQKRVPEDRNIVPPKPFAPVSLPTGVMIDRTSPLSYNLAAWLATTPLYPRSFTFERLRFPAGVSAVSETDKSILQILSQVLTAYPQARVTIIGNGAGSLGIDRANAIRDAMLQLATDPKQLATMAGDSSENPPKLTVKLEMGAGTDLDA